MTSEPLGDELLSLCRSTREVLVLVAPFMKVGAIERLLKAVSSDVRVHCITRWRPEEIVAGVSDLEVWDVLRARGNSHFGLVGNLHAKYYRGDSACLVGSANVTATALGWVSRANVELLVKLDASFGSLLTFEAELHSRAVLVSPEQYAEYQVLVRKLRDNYPTQALWLTASSALEPSVNENKLKPSERTTDPRWIPSLRNPDQLYVAYSGNVERLTNAARADALRDLAELALPPNLPREAFTLFVRWHLLQLPVVQALNDLLVEAQRFGAVRAWLARWLALEKMDFDATDAWQRLMRWLLFFVGDQYSAREANYSEVFSRRPTRQD